MNLVYNSFGFLYHACLVISVLSKQSLCYIHLAAHSSGLTKKKPCLTFDYTIINDAITGSSSTKFKYSLFLSSGANKTRRILTPEPICLYHISDWARTAAIRPAFRIGIIPREGLRLAFRLDPDAGPREWNEMVARTQHTCDDPYMGDILEKFGEDDFRKYIRVQMRDITVTEDLTVEEPRYPPDFPLKEMAGQKKNYHQQFCQKMCNGHRSARRLGFVLDGSSFVCHQNNV